MPERRTRGMGPHAEATGLPQTKFVGSTSTRNTQSKNYAQNGELQFIMQVSQIASAINGGAISRIRDKLNAHSLAVSAKVSIFITAMFIANTFWAVSENLALNNFQPEIGLNLYQILEIHFKQNGQGLALIRPFQNHRKFNYCKTLKQSKNDVELNINIRTMASFFDISVNRNAAVGTCG